MLAVGCVAAHAAEDDTFFRDLETAEAVTSPAELGAVGTAAPAQLKSVAKPTGRQAANTPVVPNSTVVPKSAAHVDAALEKSLQWEDAAGARAPASPAPLAPKDWAPDRDSGVKTQADSPSAPPKPLANANDPGKGADPEPDVAVKPTFAPASKDPLDKAATPPGGTPTAAPAATPPEPLPPLNAALKSALDKRAAADMRGAGAAERRKERDAIAFFYAAHGFSPIWSKDGKAIDAVDSTVSRLAHAGDDALTLAKVPTGVKAQGSFDEIVDSEVALSEAVVAYARQATGSRVDPRTISPLIGYRAELADPAEVLDMLVAAGPSAGDKLRDLNPSEPRYVALRDKLASMRDARMPPGTTPIPAGPVLHVGMRDPRVPLLRTRFHLDPPVGADQLKFDSELASAVAAYQRTNDLPPSGALNLATITALSGGAVSRLEGPLMANMEMWRWMPHDLGANRIEVNVPDFIVTVFHDGTPVSQNRVVVGKLDTPTPLFSNTMKYLIVNPYWNVPQSIIKKEMLPKGGGDLSYLNGRGFSADWHGGQWVVKQLPGPKNALGRIKFLFPNDYAVYLHDTPSKSLFSASKRAFSHGCVRVDQPFAFGESVLNNSVPEGARKRWSEDHLESLIGDKERYINLPVALPIHIEYFTASVDPQTGRIKQRDDVYGYAHAIAAALGQGGEVATAVERKPKVVAERVRRRASDASMMDAVADPR